jgi:hypothetical protein
MKFHKFVSPLILSLGIFGAGFCVGKALYHFRVIQPSVTVKGLAERDVRSDLGIWEIDYREVGNNLTEINQRLQHDQTVVMEFLKQRGLKADEIQIRPVKVEDRLANVYSDTTKAAGNDRFVVTTGLRVRSTNVNLIQTLNQEVNLLLQQGLTLTLDVIEPNPNPSYYFTQLDALRPEMLAEATKSARLVAQQFANDSGTKLGSIQRANQGVFQIMGRDTSTMSADWNTNQSALGSIDKKVRLVTTIDYQLK